MTLGKQAQGAGQDYTGLVLRGEDRTAMYRQSIALEHKRRLRQSPPPGKKLCPTCGRLLPLDDFAPMATAPDGRYFRCRRCQVYAKIGKATTKGEDDD